MQNSSTSTPSARSPIAWPRESFRVSLTAVVAIGAILIVFGAGVGAIAIALGTGAVSLADLQHRPPRLSANFQLWSQLALYIPITVYLLVVIRPVSALPFSALGFRRPSLRDIGVGVAGAALMWIVIAVSSTAIEALTHRHDTEAAIELIKQIHTPVQRLLFILIAAVMAPLVEEFAFRVFLFNGFRRHSGFWVAAFSSGLLFGLAHAQGASQVATVSVPLMFGGVVLAWVYETTRCYWSSALTHALFNGVSVAAVFGFGVKP
ncbi:MAG: CPBP family intramembrane metalloprotease [Candidatus Eremiobacteraeota bacterium]|nr:CPBP family intramembrane metalloprotease [Candidatus Eremiobacteraeota bacterium]MBV9647598.1 CPBP family intramembrane metalloprotease [Candidatus Eremiobacteraeota bacterium]